MSGAEILGRFELEFDIKATQKATLQFGVSMITYGEVVAGENITAHITDTKTNNVFSVDVSKCSDEDETFELIISEIETYLEEEKAGEIE